MKTLLIIMLLTLSASVFSQGYYDGYTTRQSKSSSRQVDIRDQIMNRQQNYMNNQINRGMQELEVRSNIRRYEMINGGSGNVGSSGSGGPSRYELYGY